MNEMIEFLTSKEIIVVYVIIAIAFFICFIIYLMDKSSEKRRRKQNTKKLNRLVEDVNNRLAEEEIKDEKKKKKKVIEDEVDRITKPNVSNYQNTSPINANKFVEPEVNYLPPEIDFVPPVGEKEEEVIPVANINQPLVQATPTRTRIDNNQNNSIYTGYNRVQDNTPQMEVPTLTSSSKYDGFDYGYNAKNNVNNYIVDEVTQSFNNEMDAQINRVHEKIDELIYTDPEPDREEATRELIRLTEELEKAEKAQRQGINIDAYESQQEEDAIISLDELKKRGEAMYASNESTQYADEFDEPITLDDLERRKRNAYGVEVEDPIIEESIEQVVREPIRQSNNSNAYQERKKVNDEIFSSVFGTGNTSSARTREEIDEELQKTSEFLLSLKDLQSKLNS